MSFDEAKITAYVLGELDGELGLDAAGQDIADETSRIAGILAAHFRERRQRMRCMSCAVAGCLLVVGATVSILCSSSNQNPSLALGPKQPQVALVEQQHPAMLRLTPVVAETRRAPLLADAVLKGDPALDVDQLVAAVLKDASRVASFSSLRLAADSPEANFSFQ
jgi:hypothetical protein